MLQRRNIKLDRANKSILLRALGNVYYAQKATGSDCTATGALVLRIHALPPKGKSIKPVLLPKLVSSLCR